MAFVSGLLYLLLRFSQQWTYFVRRKADRHYLRVGRSPGLEALPSTVYAPLWRIWGVLLGTLIAGIVFLLFVAGNTPVIPCCRGCVKLFATRWRWHPAVSAAKH